MPSGEVDTPTGVPATRPIRSVPILMYHQVTPNPMAPFARYTVTPKVFAAQMRWLAIAGYTPLTMAALVDCWRERRAPPRRAVVITFDDGFRDCVDFALPVLQRHRFTAVFYLVAGLVGRTSRWMASGGGVELPLMDWNAVRGLHEAGMQCGAHSMTHPALAQCSAAKVRGELVESRHLLQDRLGHEIVHLAYPYGSVTSAVRALAAEAGYLSACASEKRLAAAGDDLLWLPRVPVYGGESLLDFICRLRTAESSRQVIRRKLPLAALARKAWGRGR
jgi:peptidoglycan/xylan/chitin deacetylase (PgdA/CDA1 family)